MLDSSPEAALRRRESLGIGLEFPPTNPYIGRALLGPLSWDGACEDARGLCLATVSEVTSAHGVRVAQMGCKQGCAGPRVSAMVSLLASITA